MDNNLLRFFTLMDGQGYPVVKEAPRFDLDMYIGNYKGRTRFDRLILIGRSCVPLCIDALKAAIVDAKKGRDIQRYKEAVDCLQIAAPLEPEAVLDQAWINQKEAENKDITNRLLTELKGYKNNLIKESIRMGHEDMGKHLEATGDLNLAAESFMKMRPDVSTTKQYIDVAKHLVRVSIHRREWSMVTAHLSKLQGTAQLTDDEEKQLSAYMRIAHGIAYLGQEKYLDAALSFLEADNVAPTVYNEIASPNDVAIYGGLLALAFMNRSELQTKVLDNVKFREFLELEPNIRRAVSQFVSGRYSACISTLEAYRTDCLLDIYLQRHVKTIFQQIRNKCIVQYLIPFSRVSLDTMAKAFGSPDQPIEDELADMIKAGTLQAKIDLIDRLVVTMSANQRAHMQNMALKTAKVYERQAIDRLNRMGLVAAELDIRPLTAKFSAMRGMMTQQGDRMNEQLENVV